MEVNAWSRLSVAFLLGAGLGQLRAQDLAKSADLEPLATADNKLANNEAVNDTPSSVLSPEEWQRVDGAVALALSWLSTQQQLDGSFPTLESGQPGVTSLCIMAFMAHGHLPGDADYGKSLERATDFVLASQKANGLVSRVGPDGSRITRDLIEDIGVAAAYNHAISSLALSETYGMSEAKRSARIQDVISRALAASLEMQRWPKNRADRGGWRYVAYPSNGGDSNLSVTGWELMFLRSARNAGFDVPKEAIDDAVAYIRSCYSEVDHTFVYMRAEGDYRSRAMAGAGILALAHAGLHGSPEATQSADWLLNYNFNRYNEIVPFRRPFPLDRYHYGLLNACQGMYQMGGHYWEQFFPSTVKTLLANQQTDGSWPADAHLSDGKFGNTYTTALVVLSLAAPNQILPIFQR
jgi:hypothetical protein